MPVIVFSSPRISSPGISSPFISLPGLAAPGNTSAFRIYGWVARLRIGMVLTMLLGALAGCTPAYTEQGGKELMSQLRLTDSIEVQRSNPRLLSRHGQVCLISDTTGSEEGLAMLRSMQAAFSGYFVAVGIENEPMDYMRALAGTSCPGASYLFYVQPFGEPKCSAPGGQGGVVDESVAGTGSCGLRSYSQLTITIITGGDRMLMDRIKFSLKKSYLPLESDSQAQLSQAFERLAAALTGVAR